MTQKFYELTCPAPDDDSRTDKVWVTFHKAAHLDYYLLSNGSNSLIDLLSTQDFNDIYFETEGNCHLAAYLYYHSHGERYPYNNEWAAAITRVDATASKTMGNNSQTIQSEEMFF